MHFLQLVLSGNVGMKDLKRKKVMYVALNEISEMSKNQKWKEQR